jgi:hypothetical protein
MAIPFGIFKHVLLLFTRFVCQTNVLNLFYMREKSMLWSAIEPSASAVAVSHVYHCTI